jgi:hypothetical protein
MELDNLQLAYGDILGRAVFYLLLEDRPLNCSRSGGASQCSACRLCNKAGYQKRNWRYWPRGRQLAVKSGGVLAGINRGSGVWPIVG